MTKAPRSAIDISDIDCENLKSNFLKRKRIALAKNPERESFDSIQSKKKIKARRMGIPEKVRQIER